MEATFIRVYERLTGAETCRTGACLMYGPLPAKRHVAGNGGEVNRSEGLHSCLRDTRLSVVVGDARRSL